VFGLASWPGKILPGVISNATVSSLDFLPTILKLAGVPLPSDRSYDGTDLSPLLFDGQESVRDFLFMGDTTGGGGPRGGNITSVRYKNWKLYTKTYSQPGCNEDAAPSVEHPDYLVFDLDADPGESTPITLPKSIMDTVWQAHHAKLLDINSTFYSEVDYSTGTDMISAAPCCNPKNAFCRCEPDTVVV
jgi:arylsulfatase A